LPTQQTRRPWTFAAVCVMVPALTLLVFNLADPIIQLLEITGRRY
jgi:hypothetical protein